MPDAWSLRSLRKRKGWSYWRGNVGYTDRLLVLPGQVEDVGQHPFIGCRPTEARFDRRTRTPSWKRAGRSDQAAPPGF